MNIVSFKNFLISASALALTATTLPAAHAAPADPGALDQSIFMPMAMRSFPTQFIYGIGMYGVDASNNLNKVLESKQQWVRVMPGQNRATWGDVQTAKNTINWDAPAIKSYEADIQAATANGLTPIFILTGTPVWAQKAKSVKNDVSCGAIARANFPDFAAFAREAVLRYSKPPYNVKYWEVWNEQDAPDTGANAGRSEWGCWGDKTDPYYGGGYYGDMLAQVYTAIKQADPQANVLLGGLLMTCGVTLDTTGTCTGANANSEAAKAGRFFEGILRSIGKNSYDIVSFHGYDYFDTTTFKIGKYGSSKWGSSSDTTGPVPIAMVRYLKALMAQYGVSGKGLMDTEAALVQWECTTSGPSYEKSKAYYIPVAYAAGIAEGLMANIWFDAGGSWNCSGPFNPSFPQAGNAFKTVRERLQDAKFVREITFPNVPKVKAYELDRGDRKVWVIWSMDGTTRNVDLPSVPLAAFGTEGNTLTPAATMAIGVEPYYLEF